MIGKDFLESRLFAVLLGVTCLTQISCNTNESGETCTPGVSRTCNCPGESPKNQTCRSDGTGWQECQCNQSKDGSVDSLSDGTGCESVSCPWICNQVDCSTIFVSPIEMDPKMVLQVYSPDIAAVPGKSSFLPIFVNRTNAPIMYLWSIKQKPADARVIIFRKKGFCYSSNGNWCQYATQPPAGVIVDKPGTYQLNLSVELLFGDQVNANFPRIASQTVTITAKGSDACIPSKCIGTEDPNAKTMPCPAKGIGAEDIPGATKQQQVANYTHYQCTSPQICPLKNPVVLDPVVVSSTSSPAFSGFTNCSVGSTAVNISKLVVYGDSRCSFSEPLLSNQKIQPGDMSFVLLNYQPHETGEDHAEVRLTSDAQNFPISAVALCGIGVQSPGGTPPQCQSVSTVNMTCHSQ